MAAVQSRERSSSTKKPFQWIQRLYKKSSSQEHESNEGEELESSMQRPSDESSYPDDNHIDDASSGAGNDLSSLRPTISTRAPSIAQSTASNAAIHNFEAISSPLADPALTHTIDVPDAAASAALSERYVPLNDDDTLINDDMTGVDGGNQKLTRQLTSSSNEHFSHNHEEAAYSNTKVYTASSKSSKESSVPSMFSNKTTETAPTASLFAAPTSIISSRTGGAGAQDNASTLTLASSSKGFSRRRTSTDTNCSIRAIAPASNRASFESSRTGYTDSRRTSHFNPNSVIFLDDVNTAGPNRSRPMTADVSSLRRSVSGLSMVS